MRGPFVGVIGAGQCSRSIEVMAEEVGCQIARNGAVLVCGGLGGVMEAASRGARESGGLTIGILPGPDKADANRYIDFPIATNMGHARNVILVQSADVLISIGGSYGTLSEIALAFKTGRAVVALCPQFQVPGLRIASDPRGAVTEALSLLGRC